MSKTKLILAPEARAHDIQIRFCFHDQKKRPSGLLEASSWGEVGSCLQASDGSRMIWAGLGKKADRSERLYFDATAAAVRQAVQLGARRVVVDMRQHEDYLERIVDGIVLGAYRFESYLPKNRKGKGNLEQVQLISKNPKKAALRRRLASARGVAEAVNAVRDLGNSPGNVMTPQALAKTARRWFAQLPVKIDIWNESRLRKEGFGGLLAVGGGSVHSPRFIRLDYRGGASRQAPIVLVGKAITFDSGGLSLKPGADMDEMKFDKMGGCAVLGVLRAVAEQELPLNITGLVAAAENMPDAKAYRPGDLVRSWDGQSIEVLNTDAEGRIVLADAIGYARDRLRPSLMIDLATLTGACVVALGMSRAGLFSRDDELARQLFEAGEATGDRVWRLPVGEEYRAAMDSDIAAIKNLGERWGGACSAASFLENWAGDVPWAHLDIAGTGWTTKKSAVWEKGATGFGVRLLMRFLEQR